MSKFDSWSQIWSDWTNLAKFVEFWHLSKYKEPNVRPDVRNFSKRLLMTFSHADGPPMGPYLNNIGHNANNGNQNFLLSFKYGYFGHSIFRCYLSMTILTISNLRCLAHFFRCHLRMRQKVLLLFKYEFFETLLLTY